MSLGQQQETFVIFVEGQTDKVFYDALIPFIIHKNLGKIPKPYIVKNIRGIGNYQRKAVQIFKNQIKPSYNTGCIFTILCCYDSDVFDLKQKPPVNWAKLRRDLKSEGAREVLELKAVSMIEDWFLIDYHGLCNFLKISVSASAISGNNGNDKMKSLFKRGNKIYQKGSYSHKFITHINLDLLYSSLGSEIKIIESMLFFK
ncbi:MAG: hypothetical protein ACYCYO_22400 [Bacilli bacterium]